MKNIFQKLGDYWKTGKKGKFIIVVAIIIALICLCLGCMAALFIFASIVLPPLPSTSTPTFTPTSTITNTPLPTATATATLTVIPLAPTLKAIYVPASTPVQSANLSVAGISCIPSTTQKEEGIVVGIVDGDTIDVQINNQTYRVRYIGIDTPENGQPNYWPATGQNQALVYSKNVTMAKDKSDTDRYGRLLRYVFVGDMFVNYELVRLGFASAYRYPPDTSCADQFDTAQSQAQLEQIGIWQPIISQSGGGNGNNDSGSNCNPSYPDVCLQDAIGDYDCAGGTGNGPNYIQGPFRVIPPDPFGLDRDNDGIGCD